MFFSQPDLYEFDQLLKRDLVLLAKYLNANFKASLRENKQLEIVLLTSLLMKNI